MLPSALAEGCGYRASDTKLVRDVAAQLLPPRSPALPSAGAVQRDARAGRANHPNS